MSTAVTPAAFHSKRWRAKNPEKIHAHNVVRRAVRLGELTPEDCELCGSNVRVQAHHEDHADPIAITWLCASCHARLPRQAESPVRSRVQQGVTIGVLRPAAVRVEYRERASEADHELIARGMGLLTRAQRFVITLHIERGMTFDEIVQPLGYGTTRQNVEQVYKRGISRLREFLEPHLERDDALCSLVTTTPKGGA